MFLEHKVPILVLYFLSPPISLYSIADDQVLANRGSDLSLIGQASTKSWFKYEMSHDFKITIWEYSRWVTQLEQCDLSFTQAEYVTPT